MDTGLFEPLSLCSVCTRCYWVVSNWPRLCYSLSLNGNQCHQSRCHEDTFVTVNSVLYDISGKWCLSPSAIAAHYLSVTNENKIENIFLTWLNCFARLFLYKHSEPNINIQKSSTVLYWTRNGHKLPYRGRIHMDVLIDEIWFIETSNVSDFWCHVFDKNSHNTAALLVETPLPRHDVRLEKITQYRA